MKTSEKVAALKIQASADLLELGSGGLHPKSFRRFVKSFLHYLEVDAWARGFDAGYAKAKQELKREKNS